MHKKSLKKPDGRDLFLYSRKPISDSIVPTNPKHDPVTAQPQFRWHPLRGEWVAYATHRQNRTFLPPKDYSPLAVTRSEDFPTEMSAGEYDVAVFENLFPSFVQSEAPFQSAQNAHAPVQPANGRCEVIVFTQDPDASLGQLSVDEIHLILKVMADRTQELGKSGKIQYVLPFENRGVEMGVTLHHPHGQLYAYPFVPPVPAKMLENMQSFWNQNQKGLFQDLLEKEKAEKLRMIVEESDSSAFIPTCARYPYETWIAPNRPVAFLHDLSDDEIRNLAITLKSVILKHDGLWNRPQPYLMVLYQAPLDGKRHPEAHVHFQLFPPYRTKDRLKYLAGTELGGGLFVNDSVPEEKAAELRAVQV